MRSILAVFFGFGLSLFIEGFARIIISFFHTLEPSFFGISALPGTSWIIALYIVSFVSTWLGAMMALTIAGYTPYKHLAAFLALITLWILFETLSSIGISPTWYLITFPFTSIFGALTAAYTFKLNQNAITNS